MTGRVYLVALYYEVSRASGGNKRFDETGKRLMERHDLHVIVQRGEVPAWLRDPAKAIVIPAVPGGNRALQRVFSWLYLQYFFAVRPSATVISDFMPIPWPAVRKHRHFQIVHDLRNFSPFNRARFPRLAQTLQARQWRQAQTILAGSKVTKGELVSLAGVRPEHVVVSYNGVSGTFVPGPPPAERPIDFLYVATFEKRKNHRVLIEALGRLKASAPGPLRCVLLGKDHGLRPDVETLIARHDLVQDITIVDAIDTEEGLAALYRQSRTLVNPSLHEGFGIPLVEAMASGCHIVCSDLEVFHEVCGPHAAYFDPLSPEALCETLRQSRDDMRDTAAGAAYAQERFSWDSIANQLSGMISAQAPSR